MNQLTLPTANKEPVATNQSFITHANHVDQAEALNQQKDSAQNTFAQILRRQASQQKPSAEVQAQVKQSSAVQGNHVVGTEPTEEVGVDDATFAQMANTDPLISKKTDDLIADQTKREDSPELSNSITGATQVTDTAMLNAMFAQMQHQQTTTANAKAALQPSIDVEEPLSIAARTPTNDIVGSSNNIQAKVEYERPSSLLQPFDGHVTNHQATSQPDPLLAGEYQKAVPEGLADASALSKVTLGQETFDRVLKNTSQSANPSVGLNPVLPTSLQSLQPQTAAVSMEYIATPFGRADWNQAINQKVVMMASTGNETATLTLNPPDLGPMQVVLSVNNHHVDTTFISDNPDVRQALQDGLDHLREKMQSTGMQLGQTNISSGDQAQRDFSQAMQGSPHSGQRNAVDEGASESHVVAPVITRVVQGLVDTFA